MNKAIGQATRVMAICIAVVALASPLLAQESQTDATKKAEAEMKAVFGTVPVMMKVYPDHLRASAWGWFKATLSPDAAIPAKYSELVSLGVASQIPCDYCIYAHTTMAKMHGATDAEIKAAVASAAGTRHWSTVLNGANVSFDEFKKEWDGILAHIKKQNEAKK
ncbi:MAG: carboxymuconolactone decarboxylase family protein [Planctomycetota bacterium]|jgi:AhpD family alkylhydroperoxidase